MNLRKKFHNLKNPNIFIFLKNLQLSINKKDIDQNKYRKTTLVNLGFWLCTSLAFIKSLSKRSFLWGTKKVFVCKYFKST
jgi:hypothetical protein